MKIPAEHGSLSPPGPPQGLRTERDRTFSFPRRARKGTPGWPRSPRQFIPSFVHLLWARSGPGHGESWVSREDSCFVDFVTLPFPASLLVLFRGRPYHTEESSHLLLFKKKKKIILVLVAVGPRCCTRAFLVAMSRGYSWLWCVGFLVRWLWAPGRAGSVAVLPGVSCSRMWDLSRPGKELMSPVLASGFLTTGPLDKSQLVV